MFNINDARKQRAEAREKANDLINVARVANRDLTAEEEKEFQTCTASIKTCSAAIERHENGMPQIGGDQEQPTFAGLVPYGERAPALNIKSLMANATPDQREEIEALGHFLRGDKMALSNLTPGGDGGYLIPSFVSSVIERNFTQFDPVRSVCRRFATDSGASFTFPVLSDSESAEQVASAAATGADDVVSGDHPPTEITGPTVGAYKVSSKPVFVPRETQTDVVPGLDFINEVLGALLARVIRFENLKFTKGNGSSEAEGFLTHATPFEESGGHVTLDAALDLAYSVPALYRPNGVYMMSDSTAKYMRKLKTGISGDTRQLWDDGNWTKGQPASLHGYPVVINNDMSDVNSDGTYSGKTVLAFGDFKRFLVREAENGQAYVYRYPVPAKDGVGIIAFRRTDSKLLVPEAISKLTVGGS